MAETTEHSIAHAVKQDAGLLMVIGIITVILGVLSIMAPLITGVAIAVLVGILLLAGGFMRTLFAFRCKTWGKGLLTFVLGLLAFLCGLVMLTRPILGLTSLTLVLAVYFIVDGLFEVAGGLQLKPVNGWGWMLFGGIVSILLGLMIWRQWPVSGAWAIGILVGIKLLLAGWEMVGLGMAARAVVKT
jgi:uncharacterized membrane protein HdeD (DUF308 family)